jgi:hypothetical protein
MRPVAERFSRFTIGYHTSYGQTNVAIKATDAAAEHGRLAPSVADDFQLSLDPGEAEELRDWLTEYVEAGGR